MNADNHETERGVSDAVGFVLITGIVVTTIGVLLVFGGQAVNDAQDRTRVQQAENTISELDAETASVAYSSSDESTASRVVSLGLSDRTKSAVYVRNQSTITITTKNFDTGNVVSEETFYIGALEYRTAGTQIAYQSGGVWKKQVGSNDSQIVSPPEITYRTGSTGQRATLTAPIVTIAQDEQQIGTDSVRITRESITDQPLDTGTRIQNREVNISIQSPYYKAWGEYFQERVRGQTAVTYDHANERVNISLGIPSTFFVADDGLIYSDGYFINGSSTYDGSLDGETLRELDPLINSQIDEYSTGGTDIATFGTIDSSNAGTVQTAINNGKDIYADSFQGANLTLNGTTMVIKNDMDVDNKNISVVGDERSTIFLGGDYNQEGGSAVGNITTEAGPGGTPPQYAQGNASKLQILGRSNATLRWRGSSNFVGGVYAPGANVSLKGTPGRTGTIVAGNVTIGGTSDFKGVTSTFRYSREDEDERRIFYLHVSESKVRYEPR